jgi:hypothetical protein
LYHHTAHNKEEPRPCFLSRDTKNIILFSTENKLVYSAMGSFQQKVPPTTLGALKVCFWLKTYPYA